MKFFDHIEKILAGPMSKLANFPYIKAVRDGMVSTIPLTIVGSLFLIIAFPPVPQAWKESMAIFQWITKNLGNILLPFRLSMGLIAIFAVYNTAASLAKHHSLDTTSAGTLALVGYFLSITPKVAVTAGNNPEALGWVLPMQFLGAQGIFGGLIIAIFSVEVLRFFIKNNLVIKMPEGVPESVSKSFVALFPTLAIVILISIVTIFMGVDIHNLVGKVFQPLGKFLNGPFGVILIVFFITLLWAAGLHGVSVIGSLARPIWLDLLDQNAKALSEGAKVLPNIAPEPFYQWFIWIGGSGCTIALLLLMINSKSSHLKSLGRAAFLPGLFNINEPIIFGTPIMLNPYLVVPFILAPLVLTITTYAAMAMNLIGRPAILAPWTFPAPIGAFLATNGSIGAVLLVFVNIAIATVIYYPFFKTYEKKLIEDEKNAEGQAE